MIALLLSFLVTVAVVGAYLIGVEVGKSRDKDGADYWEGEYDDACRLVEEYEDRLRTYDRWIQQRFSRGDS